MERKKIEAAPRRRVILVDAGDEPVTATAPTQGALFEDEGPLLRGHGIKLIPRTPWESKMPPPVAGIWEYQMLEAHGKQPTGEGFLWFEPRLRPSDGFGAHNGTWHGITDAGKPASAVLGWHSDMHSTMQWRGLSMPAQDGYRYKVPGARTARVTLATAD